jgi:hypothetical protein
MTQKIYTTVVDNAEDTSQGKVTINIDNKPISIRRGQHSVSELKLLGNVPAEYALDQIVDGVLTELANNSKVHVRGNEVFSSHPRTGGAA